MAGRILITLKTGDRMQQIIPVLEKIALARETLGKMGVEATAALSKGLLRALRETMLNPDFQLILMSAVNSGTTVEVARLAMLLLRRVRRSNLSFLLLHRPQHAAHSVPSDCSRAQGQAL